METTFCELRAKEVINVVDGKRLGNIVDIVFCSQTGKIKGLVVPAYNRGFNLFKSGEDIYIPYQNVCKIGDDVILVQLCLNTFSSGKNFIDN
ncbi:MAG: YlmC/YmxH family sporulation protein [Clostridia bacterium]|nr:YlmC/YmxH family sporulation protein [Clostridia bacterium]